MLTAIGRLDLVVFAIFGAFTGIYGRSSTHRERSAMQTRAGALLFVVMLAAGLASEKVVPHGTAVGSWMVVGLTTLVATACSVIVGYLRLRPAGSLFHIFAFAAIASAPRLPPLLEGMATAFASIALAVGIGLVTWLVPGLRTPWRKPVSAPLTGEERRTVWLEGLAVLVAVGVAGSVAALTQPLLRTGHLYWAMVASVVPLVGHTTRHRLARGLHRILGTFVGLGIIAVIIVLDPSPWAAVLIIGVLQMCTELFIARNYFLGQMFVTPMALIGVGLSGGIGWALLWDRSVETVIGAGVGMSVTLALWWLSRRRGPEQVEAA